MKRRPEESAVEYHARLVEDSRRQEREDLQAARLEAEMRGKQRFDFQAFSSGYRKVCALLPSAEEMEVEYYLTFAQVRTLEEFLEAVWRSGLYDGGDLQFDR